MTDPRHTGPGPDWVNIAVWGAIVLTCVAFWAAVVAMALRWLL